MIGNSYREGTWTVWSDSDPRWKMSGTGICGGFCMPPEAERAVKAKAKELGQEPPVDLEFGYMKD